MSRIIVSAALPAPLARRVRTIAERDDRTVSYTLTKIIERALNDERRSSGSAAVQEPGGHPRHGQV